MRTHNSLKIFLILCSALLLSVPIFLAQNTSQAPSPELSPSPSPSTTPVVRAPSPTPLPGAQNFHQWGAVTVFNGLPSDSVRAIAQTPDGVMWFGTDNGLARFDGRRIQKIALAETYTDRVLALEASSSGEMWVGTSAGAHLYNGERFQAVENTEGIGVDSILIDGADVFLGTDSGLILRV